MLEFRKVELSADVSAAFYNSARDTRSGFAHDTLATFCLPSGYSRIDASCFYLNRTWERYSYQSVMQKAVRQKIDERKQFLQNTFKAENNFQKITAKRRPALEKFLQKDADLQALQQIMQQLD